MMDNDILFCEKQKFTQWWLWIFFAGMNCFVFYGIYQQIMLDKPFGQNPASNAGLLTIAAFILLLTVLFIIIRLDTVIKKDGIYVRFFPFQASFRHYAWSTIAGCSVRQYQPFAEYGGFGIRGIGKDKALIISGKRGLQLLLNDGRKLLIGTKKDAAITEAIQKAATHHGF